MTLQTFYTTKEVAAALKITPDALTRMVTKGVVNPMRLSAGDRSPMRWTDENVEQLRAALTPAAPIPSTGQTKRRRRRRTPESV